VNRLDAWLRRQVGWRRALLAWLLGCPAAIVCGCGIWGLVTPGVPGPGRRFLEIAGLSVLVAAAAVGVMIAVPGPRAALYGDRPAFSWRACAVIVSIAGATLPGMLTDQQPYWPHIHRVVGSVSFGCALAAVALSLDTARRGRRLSRGVK